MDDNLESLRSKVLKRFALIGIVSAVIVSSLLASLLFTKDRERIHLNSRENAKLIKTGILAAMMSTGDPEVVRETVGNYKKVVDFEFRMVRGELIQKQFGLKNDETPRDDIERAVLEGALAEHSSLEGTKFRLVFPFVTDARCGQCHIQKSGVPVDAGTVLGVSELVFDVTEWRDASLKVTAQAAAGITLILLAIGTAVFLFFSKDVLEPVRHIATAMETAGRDGSMPALPRATSRELAVLGRQLENMAQSMHEKYLAHQKAAEDERKKMERIKSFALKQADHMGLTDKTELDIIIKRLSEAVREVEKSGLLVQVCSFVTAERKELVLHNDIDLIRPAALYLTDLIAGTRGSVKKGSMELALEEAITNAIVHGNLDIDSRLKEEDYAEFERELGERRGQEPYRNRTVKISYDYNKTRAVFRIADEGKGFDWSTYLNKEVDPNLLPHGRGIIIIRTFASTVDYNEKGNELMLSFDLTIQQNGKRMDGYAEDNHQA